MEVIKVSPRGYCQGVVRAINIARKAAADHPGENIYMLGMIVHNRFIVDAFEKLGIICLEDSSRTRLQLLEDIPSGIVIFTAHGVSDQVYQRAAEKGLQCIDATCPDVRKTHDLVREHTADADVIYIGKHRHPEAEGVIGISDRVYLVSDIPEADALPELKDPLITCQTTLSLIDTADLIQHCLQRFPNARVMNEICNATTVRQQAVLNLRDTDALFVVGDPHSNNSRQLKNAGTKAGIPHTYLLESVLDLREEMLQGVKRAAVTSGSSTPSVLTEQLIRTLQAYADTGVLTLPASTPEKVF